MPDQLRREFVVQSSQRALFKLACRPSLAPEYLNFLTKIEPFPSPTSKGAASSASDLNGGALGLKAYQVWVNYRGLVRTTGIVRHGIAESASCAILHHDGPLVSFQATFQIDEGRVNLDCIYHAKVPFASWLIARVLDRALMQVSGAMDRYAATLSKLPT